MAAFKRLDFAPQVELPGYVMTPHTTGPKTMVIVTVEGSGRSIQSGSYFEKCTTFKKGLPDELAYRVHRELWKQFPDIYKGKEITLTIRTVALGELVFSITAVYETVEFIHYLETRVTSLPRSTSIKII